MLAWYASLMARHDANLDLDVPVALFADARDYQIQAREHNQNCPNHQVPTFDLGIFR